MGAHDKEPAEVLGEDAVAPVASVAAPWYRRPRNLIALGAAAAAVVAAVSLPSIIHERDKSKKDAGFSSEMVNGKAKTIQDYLKDNKITSTPVRAGEPGIPTVTLGLPPNWADSGRDTPSWAYGEAFMKDSADPNDPATIDVLLSKLSGDVDASQILNYAPGELQNLPDYKPLQPPNRGTLSDFESVTLGGLYTRDGQERIIAQKSVVIPTGGDVYVLQLNADAPKADAAALQQATGMMDEQAKIVAP